MCQDPTPYFSAAALLTLPLALPESGNKCQVAHGQAAPAEQKKGVEDRRTPCPRLAGSASPSRWARPSAPYGAMRRQRPVACATSRAPASSSSSRRAPRIARNELAQALQLSRHESCNHLLLPGYPVSDTSSTTSNLPSCRGRVHIKAKTKGGRPQVHAGFAQHHVGKNFMWPDWR